MGSCSSCLYCFDRPHYKRAETAEERMLFSDVNYTTVLDEENSSDREHQKKRRFFGSPDPEREKRVAVEDRYIRRQQTRAARLESLSHKAPDENRRSRTEELLGRTVEHIVQSEHDRDLLLGKTRHSQASEKNSKNDEDKSRERPQLKGAPKFSEKWYCPGTNREQAESWLLEQQEDGMFLVSNSSDQPGLTVYILSVLYRGDAHHLNITGIADKTWVLGEGGLQDKTHKSVESLIEYHSKKPVHFETGGNTILRHSSHME